jgi:hypothetical protein
MISSLDPRPMKIPVQIEKHINCSCDCKIKPEVGIYITFKSLLFQNDNLLNRTARLTKTTETVNACAETVKKKCFAQQIPIEFGIQRLVTVLASILDHAQADCISIHIHAGI